MILSAYTRKDSPWVWIQYSGQDGKKYQKTPIRKDDPERERKQMIAMNKLEAQMLVADAGGGQRRESWAWVTPYLRTRYAAKIKEGTLRVYLTQWRWISEFLLEYEIDSPGMLEREDVFDYIDWRRAQVKEKSKKSPGLNTALGEAKMLGLIMKEAIARGYAVENPATKLGIEREDAAETPAMTDAEISTAFAALQTRPAWMQRSFTVAYCTALRFATTRLSRDQVHWDRREITITKPKGGKKKAFTIPLYTELEPLLREWWKSGEPRLWELPTDKTILTGLEWTKFFREIGLPHLKFHSTRTTFITRGAIGDQARGLPPIPENVMMRLVNHGRIEVHRIYQKFRTDDVRPFAEKIPLPRLVAPTP